MDRSLALKLGVSAVVAYPLYTLGRLCYLAWASPLRAVPGPPMAHPIWGNVAQFMNPGDFEQHEEWVEEYGDTIAVPSLFGLRVLLSVDARAISHILSHTTEFQKGDESRAELSLLVGDGVLVAEGEQHRRQRRVMNPAFGPGQIRELTEIFINTSLELRDSWIAELEQTGKDTVKIEILSWLSRATLDVIGLAGFNYEFGAIAGKVTELNSTFKFMFESTMKPGYLDIAQSIFKVLKVFESKRVKHANMGQATMRRIGLQMIAEKKASILATLEKSTGSRPDGHSRDLLTLLIKANMELDTSTGEHQRMTDAEVVGQIATFIVAGHETSSTGTMWCLYALSQAPEVQHRLRDELLQVPTDSPTMDELNSLHYLDLVLKETLRLHAPVPMTSREAMVNCVIPLSKPYVDGQGKMHDSVRVGKGDVVAIPIILMNRMKQFWGSDAHEFKPERWENLPEEVSALPGVWSNLLTFINGPHSCIGYRFAIVEIKALLFTLIRAFEFELAVPASDIKKVPSIVQRPILTSDPDGGNQMPMLIKRYHPAQ